MSRAGEFGIVVTYQADNYTATVRTSAGRTLTGVPRLRSSPGEIAPLAPGTPVLLNFDYGAPFILGVLSAPLGNDPADNKFSLTDTEGFGGQGLNKTALDTGSDYRNAQEPSDVVPGDWVQLGSNGNSIGVLAGGVNVMRSTPLAQIRTHLINDLVEIISRNFRHITDMGEFTVQNNDGRINMRFRGGSDQRSEAGPDEENWTIKFDLGAEGDLLNFELCTPEGQTLFRFHVDSEGKCEIFGINGVAIHSGNLTGGTAVETVTGNKRQSFLGNHETEVSGTQKHTVRGGVETNVLGDHTLSAGNDVRTQALRDYGLSAGRNMYVAVQGNDTGESLIFDIASGNYFVNIGGVNSPNPKSGFTMKTFAGDMNHESTAGGNFNITSLLGILQSKTRKAVLSTNNIPDSVILGGSALTSHIVKYEQLEQHLMLLYQLLDTHVHVEQGTATAGPFPVVGVSGMPVVPFSSVLNSLIITLKSLTTGVAL